MLWRQMTEDEDMVRQGMQEEKLALCPVWKDIRGVER